MGQYDEKWIDVRLEMLSRHLTGYVSGKRTLFEPTGPFYEALETGEDADLARAASEICEFIGLRTCPAVSYEWGIKLPPGAGGQIARYGNDSFIGIPIFFVGRPAALGRILSHEITHAFLHRIPFSGALAEENEPLTDLASIYLGLGKAILNGFEVVTSPVEKRGFVLGYLDARLTAYAYTKVLGILDIDEKAARANLNQGAIMLLESHKSSGR